jgi:hypothetical protein
MATDKELKAAAKELNEVLGIQPPINVKAPGADLTKGIKSAIKLITDDDEFTDETQEVIDELKVSKKTAPAPPPPPAKKKAAPVVEEEDDDDDDDEEPVPAPKNKKKAAPVVEDDDDDDDDDEEPAPKAKKKAVAPEVPAKKKKAPVIEEDDDDDDDEEPAPKGKKKSNLPAVGKIGAPESQTGVIRSLLKEKKMTRAKLLVAYAEKFGVTEKQADARMKLYEKAYGSMGVNDKNK